MIQRIVTILADPSGRAGEEIIWDTAAREIVEAVILDTLYTAPDHEKNLITVKRRLADLDATADEMIKTLHRPGPGGEPETHPFIRGAGLVAGRVAEAPGFAIGAQCATTIFTSGRIASSVLLPKMRWLPH
jgi:hypothetical protein